ncbi:MAG: twin-arginine translocation signal domain-containing protein [Anaerosomatales bacterium]|nr:twin-arginine translocation signal domain-containing protein [Anaerosomatales bacterium]
MATHDKEGTGGKFELTRRDFLKAGAAAAVVGAAGADLVFTPSRANAADVAATYTTTCPYCSAQCGQKVDVAADGTVLDIYGDPNSPTNRGGLCAKGAGSYQLVTNPRRLGVPEHTAAVDGFDFTGEAWKRIGNGSWTPISLDTAMTEIATQLVSIRGTITPGDTAASNSKKVMFFGSSHMNNEPNYLYRKIIANFGTSNVEHQARI